jgi:hypothetical protein
LVYPKDGGGCRKFSAERYARLSQLPVSVANHQWETGSDLQVACDVHDQGPDAAATVTVDVALKVPDVPAGLCVNEPVSPASLSVPGDVPADCCTAAAACKDGDAAAGGCQDLDDAKKTCLESPCGAAGGGRGRDAAGAADGGHGRDAADLGCEGPSPTHMPAVDPAACGARFHDRPIHVAVTQPRMETAGLPQVVLEPSIPMTTGCVWTFEPPDHMRVVPWYGPGRPPLCWVLAWGAYVEDLAMHGVWELICGAWTYRQLW